MDGPLTIFDPEPLREPTLVLGYAGWNDAGEAATHAAQALLEQFTMSRYACIDVEEFLDFTVVRPHVKQRPEGQREIVWPQHEFFAARCAEAERDLVVGLGVEPNLRWKAYTRSVVELAQVMRAGTVVLLGALLDEVIYSQPVSVGVHSQSPELRARGATSTSSYEGPIGIVGVLAHALGRAGFSTSSLWARVPHYVPTQPNPKASLALLQKLAELTGLPLDLEPLERESASFDQEVTEIVTSNPELSAYVRELKRRAFTS